MTLPEQQQHQIEQATVTLLGQGGRGVLIPGQMILTAAHCVTYKTEGEMALGAFFIEEVRTAQGTTLKARPLFLDPLADIALLGALDGQEFPDEEEAYTAWCKQTSPIALAQHDLPFDTAVPVQVWTHLGQWIRGTVRQMRYEAHALATVMDTQIEGGTSGSPVITAEGLIVGVVSYFNDTGAACTGAIPRPHLTLPTWALRQMDAHEGDEAGSAARLAWYGLPPATDPRG